MLPQNKDTDAKTTNADTNSSLEGPSERKSILLTSAQSAAQTCPSSSISQMAIDYDAIDITPREKTNVPPN
jgi:hypothetical protein